MRRMETRLSAGMANSETLFYFYLPASGQKGSSLLLTSLFLRYKFQLCQTHAAHGIQVISTDQIKPREKQIDEIEIVRVLHQRMDFENRLS
jgi:hypothetical protein